MRRRHIFDLWRAAAFQLCRLMQGFTVNIESGAGVLSQFRDEDFAASGAKIVNKTDAFKQVSIQSWRNVTSCIRTVAAYLQYLYNS